jgi:hypothetical protein
MVFQNQFSAFDYIADAILPMGSGAVVAFSHVYFDESGTHDGSRVIALGGYWFDADQARKFSRDWAKELERFGLPSAHQTDCALGFGDYAKMPKAVRVEVQKSLILHIKRRSRFSICVCMNRAMYDDIFEGVLGAPSAYTFLLLLCVNKISEDIQWRKYNGKVAYFFEAGHADQSEANKFMNFLAEHSRKDVDAYRYAGHAFAQKEGALPLQAADMLVWQTRHYLERQLDGYTEPRKDFVALTRKCDLITVVEPTHMLALRQFYANAGAIFGDKLTNPNVKMPGLDVAEGIVRSLGLSLETALEVRRWLAKQDY